MSDPKHSANSATTSPTVVQSIGTKSPNELTLPSSSELKLYNKTSSKAKMSNRFFTTSDMLNTINSVLKESDDTSHSEEEGNGYFQLQRRLPDGQTTRPATNDEVAAADFQSKLQQATAQVANLSPREKIKWSQQLRQEANNLFKESQFKQAMDLYLTCLVGLFETSDLALKREMQLEIQIPTLLNLVICCHKLGMYSKSIKFCNYALDLDIAHSSAKAFYLRGKSYMLAGLDYTKAKSDFETALLLCKDNSKEQTNIQKEIKKVQQLHTAAINNQRQFSQGMQKLFKSQEKNTMSNAAEKECEKNGELFYELPTIKKKREYSTIRAPKSPKPILNPKFQNHISENNQGVMDWIIFHIISFLHAFLALFGIKLIEEKED